MYIVAGERRAGGGERVVCRESSDCGESSTPGDEGVARRRGFLGRRSQLKHSLPSPRRSGEKVPKADEGLSSQAVGQRPSSPLAKPTTTSSTNQPSASTPPPAPSCSRRS